MMKRFAAIGIAIGLVSPLLVHAQTSEKTMFEMFYEEAGKALPTAEPTEQVVNYVIEEMKKWGENGIQITKEDVTYALAGTLFNGDMGLCVNKKDKNGAAIEFVQGGALEGACISLQRDILSLLQAEQEAEQLGVDLLTIANGAELSVADQPHRPVDMASIALLLRRVWSGGGPSVIPWDKDVAESEFKKLENDLKSANLDKAVLRFQHGYFRDKAENDPRFSDVEQTIADDLKALADKLGITGDPAAVGIFTIPKLQGVANVALWARKDDLGLMWIYPTHLYKLELKTAGTYPSLKRNSEKLAYPFDYTGSATPAALMKSPLCSRSMGRQGYLCRTQPVPPNNCDNTGAADEISLVKCSEKKETKTDGPLICDGFDKIFLDNGTPLIDPNFPGGLNPALTPADVDKVCDPETAVLYQNDVPSHACYVAFCLAQSMNGHSLVPNRNPVVFNEATSPYLACIRPDPQLALYIEIANDSPYPLPPYIGHFLARDFDRQFCSANGNTLQPLSPLCAFQDNESARLPDIAQIFSVVTTAANQAEVQTRLSDYNAIAATMGERAALDQSIQLNRKVFARLAHTIKHIAELILQLKKSPLTQTACPWTGPFKTQ